MVIYLVYAIKDNTIVATAFSTEKKAKAYVAVNPEYKWTIESYLVHEE